MTVSLVQWRAVIGIFNCCCLVISKSIISRLAKNLGSLFEILLLCFNYLKSTLLFLLTFLYILFFHDALEILSSILVQGFQKLPQLKAYISTYKHDFVCLSETFLDSSTPDNLLDIQEYN